MEATGGLLGASIAGVNVHDTKLLAATLPVSVVRILYLAVVKSRGRGFRKAAAGPSPLRSNGSPDRNLAGSGTSPSRSRRRIGPSAPPSHWRARRPSRIASVRA